MSVTPSDLYSVKVANNYGCNKVIMEESLYIKALEGMKFVPVGLKRAVVDRVRQQFVNIHTCAHFDFLFN
ncbi:hypothetical protein [Cytobacillus oceanisediminis]|uniref:hypothetical protein n=1 Tax=Cytobacillus oceanisediminis TaxID=665099 RepID=UPI003736087D